MKYTIDNLKIYIPDSYKKDENYVLQVFLPCAIEKLKTFDLTIKVPFTNGTITGLDTHLFELTEQQKLTGMFKPIVLVGSNHSHAKIFEKMEIGYIEFKNDNYKILNTIKNFKKLPFIDKIKIIHSHHNFSNYFVCALKDYYPEIYGKIPTVMTCHTWFDENLMAEFYTYLNYFSYKSADAVITVCKKHKQFLEKKFNIKNKYIVNILNGTSEQKKFNKKEILKFKQKYNIDETKKTIGFVGRLSGEKRVDVFLRSCKEISKSIDANFLIVGNGRNEAELKNLCKELNMENNVKFLGYISPCDIAYSCIDLLIQPSDNEGSPRTIIEAMSASIPVIATNVGGIPEIINKNNGYIVKKGDYKTIAKKAIEILSNNELLNTMSKNAQLTYSKKLTIKVMQLKIDKVYKKIIDSKI